MKTVSDIRESFWLNHSCFQGQFRAKKRQNSYPCDTRMAFCDWVDYLRRDGQITEKLANRATL